MSSERPFEIKRIDHLVLRVQDLQRAVAFYRDVLGCTVARERPTLGMVHLHAGASMIDLVSVDGALGVRGGPAAGGGGGNLEHLGLRIGPFRSGDERKPEPGQLPDMMPFYEDIAIHTDFSFQHCILSQALHEHRCPAINKAFRQPFM